MKNNFKNSPIGFVIPQIEDNTIGLKKFDKKFENSEFVSPMFGNNVVDKTVSPQKDVNLEVDKRYDSFREAGNKKISNEKILKEHGTLYPEFDGVESYSENKKTEEKIIFEQKNITEEINTVSFDPIVFNAPKEDYSTKEQSLPPFFFKNTQIQEDEIKEPMFEEPMFEEPMFEEPKFQTPIQEEDVKPVFEQKVEEPFIFKQKRAYVYPPLSLLTVPQVQEQDNPDFLIENRDIINKTLSEFGIHGQVESYTYGPTVTRYEIKLAPGINVKKILSIQDSIKMQLSAKTIRIEAPIPGKPHVGIEVPNRKAQMVHYYDIVNTNEFKNSKNTLKIALGKDIDGNSIYTNIEEMPHGLIAGATASGKSVCINTLLTSLLLKHSPEELRLVLIDPKMVELASYDGLPHLITPVITEASISVLTLKWAVDEMERRYTILMSTGVRNIEEYNEEIKDDNNAEKLPFIVIVIDEFGDLTTGPNGSELEEPIKRIAQKARAAGIHLILATQRPSIDVIKGTIKANIPGRIAFRVAQSVDSQTILDSTGAETLLGKGDMLLKTVDGFTRVQGAFISGKDITKITKFIKENNECEYIFTHEDLKTNDQTTSKSDNNDDLEILYSAALQFLQNQSCSINSLQQQFNIGFNRAQKIVDQLEKMNIVSSKNGTVSRQVLVTRAQLDEIFNIKG